MRRVRGTAETEHAARLARQMGRHFGHKVRVEIEGEEVHVWIPAGEFHLRPDGGVLRIEAAAEDAAGLERVQTVAADHLRRFGRAEALEVDWAAEP